MQNRERRTNMKVSIDESSCIGCGLCTGTAPEVFELSGSVASVIAQPTKAASKSLTGTCLTLSLALLARRGAIE